MKTLSQQLKQEIVDTPLAADYSHGLPEGGQDPWLVDIESRRKIVAASPGWSDLLGDRFRDLFMQLLNTAKSS